MSILRKHPLHVVFVRQHDSYNRNGTRMITISRKSVGLIEWMSILSSNLNQVLLVYLSCQQCVRVRKAIFKLSLQPLQLHPYRLRSVIVIEEKLIIQTKISYAFLLIKYLVIFTNSKNYRDFFMDIRWRNRKLLCKGLFCCILLRNGYQRSYFWC